MADQFDYDVLVAGAGPVGLTLAIDLARRGVRTILVERQPTPNPWPKFDRCNARTMEIFRRMGLSEDIRALGFPSDAPMDIFITTRLCDPAILQLSYPSVGERRATIANTKDASEALEPYQLVAQNKLEPLLKSVAEGTSNLTVRYSCRLDGFQQDHDGVSATLVPDEADAISVRARFLVGCDGGRSGVRKALGIALSGKGGDAVVQQICFRSNELFGLIPIGKGRHYYIGDQYRSTLVVQGDRQEFTLNTSAPEDIDHAEFVRQTVGFPFEFEIFGIGRWKPHLLLADRYGGDRTFIAGDAAHLVIPSGGLGMNSGVGDATNLSWKLSAVVHGWGGPDILRSYEAERRPVGVRNRQASEWATDGIIAWRRKVRPEIRDEGPEGEAARHEVAEAARENHWRVHEMVGAELGYSYAGSPIICEEANNPAHWDLVQYEPHTRPGVRLPHIWLSDGRAMQDLLGPDFTLIDLTGRAATEGFEEAFYRRGIPLEILQIDDPHVRSIYGCSFLLVRPDLHVAWRGDALPIDALAVAERVVGMKAALT